MEKWRIFLLGAVVLGGLYEGQKWLGRRHQNEVLAASLASGDLERLAAAGLPKTCLGKKYCITAFVAPWCPVCKSSEGTFKTLNRYLPAHRAEVGFGVVIGAASPAENSRQQKELGDLDAITDDSGQIMKLRQVRAFPTWIATDDSGREIFRQAGGLQVTDEARMPQVVTLLLGQ